MKVNIPNAINKRNKFVGNPTTNSTRNWFEFCPDFYKRLIPQADIDVKFNGFCRTLPLPVPTFGRCSVVYRGFFVPYSSVFAGFNDFIANTLHVFADNSTSLIAHSRRFSEEHFVYVLLNHSTQVSDNSVPFDFSLHISANSTTYWKVSSETGKRMLKIFHSLGYALRGYGVSSATDHFFDALPLLALCRVYLDYYYPNQFRNFSDYIAVKQILSRDTSVLDLSTQDLTVIFSFLIQTCYKDHLFVDSFLEPSMPNTPFNDIGLTDITSSSPMQSITLGSYNSGADPDQSPKTFVNGELSQNQLNLLQRLTQYFKRNQYAGGLAFDRLLARFGIKVYNDCSKYIGTYRLPISIGEVMSTTDNYDPVTDTGASLGSYSGKAIGSDYNNQYGHFYHMAPTYGIFLVVASVIPETDYFQGVDRENLCTTLVQMYQPEFDGVAPQAVQACEVYNFHDNANVNPDQHTSVFSFGPAYYEKKVFPSHVIGDYRLGSMNAGLDAYHLMRQFSDSSFGNDYTNVELGINFVRALDWAQYNRIFGLAKPKDGVNPDAFRLRTEYFVEMYANMRSLYDDIDFDQLQHNGSGSSNVEITSAKLN